MKIARLSRILLLFAVSAAAQTALLDEGADRASVTRCVLSSQSLPASRKRLTDYELLPTADRSQAPAIEFEQLIGVILGFGRRSRAGESDAGRGRSSEAGGHGDKLHQIEGDIFVAAGSARTRGGCFFHDSFSSSGNNGDLVVFVEVLQPANDCAIHDDVG
jgi:hypothetical protein